MVKTTMTLYIDSDIKDQSMKIIQQDMNGSMSGFVQEKLSQLINRHSNKSTQEVKK